MEDPVVLLERNLYGHPLAGLYMRRQFEKILLKYGWEKVSNWECLFVHRGKGLFLSVFVDDIKLAGKKQNMEPMWKVLNKEVDLGEPTSFFDHVYLDCTRRHCNHVRIQYFRRSNWKITMIVKSEYLFVVLWHGRSCHEMCGTISWVGKQGRLNNSTKYKLRALMTITLKRKNLKSVGDCQKVCSQIVLKMLILGTYWKTWYSMDSEQTCTANH